MYEAASGSHSLSKVIDEKSIKKDKNSVKLIYSNLRNSEFTAISQNIWWYFRINLAIQAALVIWGLFIREFAYSHREKWSKRTIFQSKGTFSMRIQYSWSEMKERIYREFRGKPVLYFINLHGCSNITIIPKIYSLFLRVHYNQVWHYVDSTCVSRYISIWKHLHLFSLWPCISICSSTKYVFHQPVL